MGPSVRPVQLSDLPQVMEIDSVSLPRPWSAAVWRQELQSPLSRYLKLGEEDTISGYIGVKRIADELHVMNIAVRPEHRRRGHARKLIEAALDEQTDARTVYLEVRPGNVSARALYESLGFVETGIRPRYYGDEDALLMTLYLRDSRKTSAGGHVPPSGAESPPGSRKV